MVGFLSDGSLTFYLRTRPLSTLEHEHPHLKSFARAQFHSVVFIFYFEIGYPEQILEKRTRIWSEGDYQVIPAESKVRKSQGRLLQVCRSPAGKGLS